MAIINFTGFETGDTNENATSGAGVSIVTTPVKTGTYSARTNAITTGTSAISLRCGFATSGAQSGGGIGAGGTVYFSFWFRAATLPASGDEEIAAFFFTAIEMGIRIDSTGKLIVYDSTGAASSTGATALSTGTWYRISGSFVISTTGAYSLKINGTSELSGTLNFGSNTIATMWLGKHANNNGNTVDFFYDNVIIDDATEPNGTTFVAISHPAANGTTMSWTSGTGASDYTQINETVPSAAEYVMSPASGSNNLALFTIQSMATVGISGYTYKAIKAMRTVREDTAVTSSDVARVVSNGTNSDKAAVNLSTSAVLYANLLTTDPGNGNIAWTETNLNAIQFGSIEANAVSVRMEWGAVGILYDTTPPPVNASVAQVHGTLTATGGTQTIAAIQDVSISQSAATVTATGGTQSVSAIAFANASVTQVHGTLTATGGTQGVVAIVVASASITQVAATITATGGTQTAQSRATVAQVAANVTASGGTQVITTVRRVNISQAAATVTAAGGTQTISAQINTSITQIAASITATGGTQSVAAARKVTIAQVYASITAAGGTQVIATSRFVAITQIAAAPIVTGGTQSIASRRNVILVQQAANIIAAGGANRVVVPPKFVPLSIILETHETDTVVASDTNIAPIQTGATIGVVSSPTNTGTITN